MKSSKNNLFKSNSLIFISLLSLFCFLVYWNFDQFKKEKTDFLSMLDEQVELTEGDLNKEIIDSFIAKITVLGDPDETLVDVQNSFDVINMHGGNMNRVDVTFTDSIQTLNVQFDSIPNFAPNDIRKDYQIIWSNDSSNLNQNTFTNFEFQHMTKDDENQYFDDKLEERLESKGVDVVFFRDYENTKEERKISMDVDSSFDVNSFVKSFRSRDIEFMHIDQLILKKILPNIIISLLLFSLLLFSFYTIWNNWKREEQLLEIKNEFVSNMTHELKTPISTVGVALEAMKGFGVLDDRAKTNEYIDISQKELNRLTILVDKVLKMSNFEKGELVLKKEELEVDLILEDILDSMKLHLDQKNISISLEKNGTNFITTGDRIHLTNVFYNLIDNAIKYSPEQPEIEIVLSARADKIGLRVKDNGMGIDKLHLDKIFDRFYRVPNNDRHNIKGHGLGLNYVKKIVEKHEGQIDVVSTIGVGTTFIVELPKIS